MEQAIKNLTVGKALLIGLCLGAFYYFMLYDDGTALETQIATVTQELAAAKTEAESVRKAIVDAERYQNTMAALGSEIDRIQKAMPSKLNATDLMKVISTEAKSVGAEINQITAGQSSSSYGGDPAEKKYYDEIPIQIEMTGTYGQIMLFLSNLTKLDKIITAKRLDLSLVQQGLGPNKVPSINLKTTLQAYKYVAEVKSAEGAAQ